MNDIISSVHGDSLVNLSSTITAIMRALNIFFWLSTISASPAIGVVPTHKIFNHWQLFSKQWRKIDRLPLRLSPSFNPNITLSVFNPQRDGFDIYLLSKSIRNKLRVPLEKRSHYSSHISWPFAACRIVFKAVNYLKRNYISFVKLWNYWI